MDVSLARRFTYRAAPHVGPNPTVLHCTQKPSLGGVAERSEFKNNIIAGGDVTFSKGDRREAVVDEGLDFACEIQKAKLSMLPGYAGFAG